MDQEGKDVYQDSIIHEKLDKIIQYLENKNKLSNKSTKYFYEDDARPHPRGRFDLYPDITID